MWEFQDNQVLNKENKRLKKDNEKLQEQLTKKDAEIEENRLLLDCLNVYLMEKGELQKFIRWAKNQDYGTITDIDNELMKEWRNIE